MKKPKKGKCRFCGCTQERGCSEGCSWTTRKQDACTACVPAPQQLCDLFAMVVGGGATKLPTLKTLRTWSEDIRAKAQKVLGRIHLEASDNIIPGRKPKIPRMIARYLK